MNAQRPPGVFPMVAMAVPLFLAGCGVGASAIPPQQLRDAPEKQLMQTFGAAHGAAFFGGSAAGYASQDEYIRAVRMELVRRWSKIIPPEHQEKIIRGEVCEGMVSTEVYLAWGPYVYEFEDSSPYGKVTRWRWEFPTRRSVTMRDSRVIWWNVESR